LIMNEILAPPPPIDNGRPNFVWKEKIFTRPYIAKNKAPKNYVKKKVPVRDSRHRS
jgi:hypothetical protein